MATAVRGRLAGKVCWSFRVSAFSGDFDGIDSTTRSRNDPEGRAQILRLHDVSLDTKRNEILLPTHAPSILSALRASLPLHSLRFFSLAGWLSTASNILPHVFNLIAPPPRARTSGVDLARSAKVGLLGILLNGFALGAWYRVLDRYIGSDRYVRRRFVFQALSPHLLLFDIRTWHPLHLENHNTAYISVYCVRKR